MSVCAYSLPDASESDDSEIDRAHDVTRKHFVILRYSEGFEASRSWNNAAMAAAPLAPLKSPATTGPAGSPM